ncbi:IS1634 family transposase [Methanomassiliicoccus luminyensis]|uniref:IS1634 family transposase n=1 Tax=Methanomassiliicoccus luminyensis TaxID=1080712 RepID=UPI0003755B4C|nr:IS1634 family transposase [Methanomassiliicoccus luminyensis]
MFAYKLGDNFSVLQAGEWMNRTEVGEHYELPPFNVKTLYRAVETLGRNRERIVRELQDRVLKLLDLETTDILMDWTSIVYYGDMASLAKYGYSRDHRPDKKQVTLGVAQLAPPVNVPMAMTVEAGNMNDEEHFRSTYNQVRNVLDDSSLIVFDKGANDKRNLESSVLDRNDYLTSKKLNIADDKVFRSFDRNDWESIDEGVYALKRMFPSRVNYYFFSEKLKDEHLASRRRKAERLLAEARMIQDSLDDGKRLPKRFRINDPLVDVRYDYQTKLASMDEQEALRLLLDQVIDGREGCFCLTSSRDMDAEEALRIYRSKDAVEKLFHSLKSEIEVRPLRVWSDDAVYGVLLLGFIAQLMISLTRFFVAPVKSVSTKFISNSLQNLTLTVVRSEGGRKQRHYSNFDALNRAILAGFLAETDRCRPGNGAPGRFRASQNDVSNSRTQ